MWQTVPRRVQVQTVVGRRPEMADVGALLENDEVVDATRAERRTEREPTKARADHHHHVPLGAHSARATASQKSVVLAWPP